MGINIIKIIKEVYKPDICCLCGDEIDDSKVYPFSSECERCNSFNGSDAEKIKELKERKLINIEKYKVMRNNCMRKQKMGKEKELIKNKKEMESRYFSQKNN